jgi:hypothetical protein
LLISVKSMLLVLVLLLTPQKADADLYSYSIDFFSIIIGKLVCTKGWLLKIIWPSPLWVHIDRLVQNRHNSFNTSYELKLFHIKRSTIRDLNSVLLWSYQELTKNFGGSTQVPAYWLKSCKEGQERSFSTSKLKGPNMISTM